MSLSNILKEYNKNVTYTKIPYKIKHNLNYWYSRNVMKSILEIGIIRDSSLLKKISSQYKYYYISNNINHKYIDNIAINQNCKVIKYSSLYCNDIHYIYYYIKKNKNFDILKYVNLDIQYTIIYKIFNNLDSHKKLLINFINYIIKNYNILLFFNIDIIKNIYTNTILLNKYNEYKTELYTCLDILSEHNILFFNIDEISPYNIEELKILHSDEYIKNYIQEIIDLFLVKFNNKTIIFFDNYNIYIYQNNKLLLIENEIKNPDILLNHNYYNYQDYNIDKYYDEYSIHNSYSILPTMICNLKPYNFSLEFSSCELKVNYNIILQVIKKSPLTLDIEHEELLTDTLFENNNIKLKINKKLKNNHKFENNKILKYPLQKYNKPLKTNFNYRR